MATRKPKETPILCWHFLPNDMKLKHGDRRLVRVGETLSVEGDIIPCEHGLHACSRAMDALGYTDNNALVVCRVECWGDVVEESDKLAARHRKVLWMYNAERVLNQFSVDVAQEALDLYATDSDDPTIQKANVAHRELLNLKRKWLNGELTDEGWEAAWGAARGAERGAAWRAAREAAWGAAWEAARGAARGAAWEAARGAAWRAAREAALDRFNDRLEAMLIAGAEVDVNRVQL